MARERETVTIGTPRVSEAEAPLAIGSEEPSRASTPALTAAHERARSP